MKSFSIRAAKDNFPALVRAAQEGETTILTNRGTPVAKIAPLEDGELVGETAPLQGGESGTDTAPLQGGEPGAETAPLQEAELQDKRHEGPDLPTFEQALLTLPHYLDF